MSIEDRIRSLTRNEVKVLYWKCRGEQYKQTAARYGKTSVQWAQGLMTSVYAKLGVDKEATQAERMDFLNVSVCEILDQLLESKPDNLERWPLYGSQVLSKKGATVIYTENEKDDTPQIPDPEILAFVLADERLEDDRLKKDRLQEQERRRRVEEERSRRREQRLKEEREEEAQRRREEERKKREEDTINVEPPKRLRGPIRTSPVILFVIAAVICVSLLILTSSAAIFLARGRSSTEAAQTEALAPSNAVPLIQPPSPTGVLTLTPGPPLIPTISPTPVPWPIIEDFSRQYSDDWQVLQGFPVVTEEGEFWREYSGVLTAKSGQTVSLMIGNTAWADYSIALRAWLYPGRDHFVIGVRVIDPKNMVALECDNRSCNWVIKYRGYRDVILERQIVNFGDSFTFTVEGNYFVASGRGGPSDTFATTSLILPERYAGLNAGGVLIEFRDAVIDYIEIRPLP